MKIQYCSDLHLEFKENKNFLTANPLKPVGDILLLAGDILPFHLLDKQKDFFNYVSDNFKYTYWLHGNHEYYHSEAAAKSGTFKEKIRSNVFLVNNVSVEHSDIKFIFSTLWTKLNPANEWEIERSINDFTVIRYNGYRFSSQPYNLLHDTAINFIKEEVAKVVADKVIVVTHHVPTFLNYPPQYKGSILNDAFGVELFHYIECANIDYWIYGHHHCNTPDFTIGKTSMLTNQLGYVQHGEHILFDNAKTISL